MNRKPRCMRWQRRCPRRCDERVVACFQATRAAALSATAITATLIIVIPIALALICFAARLHIIELSHTVRAELLFALLLALMASGMPISIALGLSVLTYLFILSDVDPKMVGPETVHQYRPLRDHGDPVFHPGRQFPHCRRRGAPHDRFCLLADRALVWRPRACRRCRVCSVCGDLRLVGRDRRRHRLDHPAGLGRSKAIRRVFPPA